MLVKRSGEADGRMHASRRASSRRNAADHVGGLRVSWLLLLVALVPVLGLGVVTWSSIQQARRVGAAAHDARQLVDDAASMTIFDGLAIEEMMWRAINGVGESFGAPPEMVGALLGGDATAALDAATAATDAFLAEHDLPVIEQAVIDARSASTTFDGVVGAYGRLDEVIDEEVDRLLDELADTPLPTADDQGLGVATDELRAAIAARGAVIDSFYAFFATSFDLGSPPADELLVLVEARRVLDGSFAELAGSVTGSAAVAEGLATVEAGTGTFRSAIDELIERSLATGLPERATELTIESVFADVDSFTAMFDAARDAQVSTLDLIDAATIEVVAAADRLDADADARARLAYGLAIALSITTLVAAVVATRLLVRPLRRLQQTADDLRTLDGSFEVHPTGPREVRAATLAIGQAAEHFELVAAQTRALAAGDLDDDVLASDAPGGLGGAVQSAVGTLRDALAQQEEFRRRLAHEASHDGLTQISNRNASMSQLARSLARTARSSSRVAVLFIDLDHFKEINDHHGHQAGDTVLSTVARRLVATVREGDHVGRLGGDEFVVIAEPVADIGEAIGLAERLRDELERPIQVGDLEVRVGASIGLAVSDGAAGLTADELLRDADLAVYRVKTTGRGGVEVCDEGLRRELVEVADLSAALRRAIEHDEFTMYYQPIVDSQDGSVRAFESLIRWMRPGDDHPTPPDSFIGFAERSHLIIDIDQWVLDAVARQISAWSSDPDRAGRPVAVNVSGRHLADDRFVDHVLAPLRRHDVDPQLVIIEITESAVLDDLESAAVKLQRLRDAGVQIAIDDFGTGYTSLAHLRSLPIDTIKIDRSFTAETMHDADGASLVKLIIDTGHLLGASITAEGVETESEMRHLTELGSDALQGYFFARPAPYTSSVPADGAMDVEFIAGS